MYSRCSEYIHYIQLFNHAETTEQSAITHNTLCGVIIVSNNTTSFPQFGCHICQLTTAELKSLQQSPEDMVHGQPSHTTLIYRHTSPQLRPILCSAWLCV